MAISPLPTVENLFTPKKIWSISAGDGIGAFYSNLRLAFQKNTLFSADRHGIVKALDIANGNEKWKVDLSEHTHFFSSHLPALLSGGLAVSGNKVYVGSEKAVVFALNSSDGRVVWKTKVSGEVISRPVISDNTVLIHSSNGQLQALNEFDGALKWTVNLGMPFLSLRGESTPAIAFGAAIVGSDNGYISAVLLQQGKLIWQQRISKLSGATEIDRLNDVDTTPIIIKDTVYTLGYNGNLAALDLRSGQIIWKRELSSVNDFIINAGCIYLVDQDDRLVAIRSESGITAWTQSDLLHRKLTPPVIFKGYIVIGDAEGYLHWIKSSNGCYVAHNLVDSSGFLSAPLVADNKLIIQARGGRVHILTH